MKSNIKADIKQTRQITGGCHCQAVRFTAAVDATASILRCNCSICSMTGFEHLIVSHHDFSLISGKTQLLNYQFNTQQAKHLFCSICGVKSFYQPRSHPNSWSINTKCIDGFDSETWKYRDFNGKNWQQANVELNQN